jgi:hypothetical protein
MLGATSWRHLPRGAGILAIGGRPLGRPAPGAVALAGYYGGLMHDVPMRTTEAFRQSAFVFVIVVVVTPKSPIRSIILAIALVSWLAVARWCAPSSARPPPGVRAGLPRVWAWGM